MLSTKKILSSIAYSNKNKKTIAYSKEINTKEADMIIEEYSHLITDPKYKPFFYKKLYTLGRSTFAMLASRAKEGRNPAALFVHLLKEYDQKR